MISRFCYVFIFTSTLGAMPGLAEQRERTDPICEINLQVATFSEAVLEIGTQCSVSVLVQGEPLSSGGPYVLNGTYGIKEALKQLIGSQNFDLVTPSNSLFVLSSRPVNKVANAIVAADEPPQALDQREPEEPVVVEDSEKLFDRVLVKSTRFQNVQYIDNKRNNTLVSDSLHQDEIGLQPDFNIVDASRRIAGVAGYRDEEEGISIGLRGLSPEYVNVTLDGNTIATSPARSMRRDFVEILPPSLFQFIEVSKSRNATIDGATIGGRVDFKSRSAFDADTEFFAVTGLIGKFTADRFDLASNDPAVRLNGVYTKQIGAADSLGVVIAGSYFRRDQDEERVLTFYNDDFQFPNVGIWNGIESPFERFGGYSKLEYRHGESAQFELAVFSLHQDEMFNRASNILIGDTDEFQAFGNDRGQVASADTSLEFLSSADSKLQSGIIARSHFSFGDYWKFDVAAAHSKASFEEGDEDRSDIRFDFIGSRNEIGYDFIYQGRNQPPIVRFISLNAAQDSNNYALHSINRNTLRNDDYTRDLDIRARFDVFGSGIFLLSGLGYETFKHSFRTENSTLLYSGDSPLLLPQFGGFSESYTPPYGPQRSPIVNATLVDEFIESNSDLFVEIADPAATSNERFQISESVLNGYLSLQYENEYLHANLGARIESTRMEASAFANISGFTRPLTETNQYVNVLPSMGVRYNIAPDFVLRAAYSKALARAAPIDLSPGRSVINSTESSFLTGGNPSLSPRLSDNFDISLEYYFDEGRSLASLALFHKSIDDEIFRNRSAEPNPDIPLIRFQPQNVGQSIYSGVEFNVIKDRFDFVPSPFDNFGLSANVTLVDATTSLLTNSAVSRTDFTPIEQPSLLANAALFYQSGNFDARLSYSLAGEYLNSLSAESPDADDKISAFETLDAQIRFGLTDQLTLIFDGRNLLNEKNIERSGPNQSRVEDYSEFGSAYFIGLTYRH